MVLLELFMASRFKKVRNNRFVKSIIDVAKEIDPDKTLNKLKNRRRR